MSANVNEAIMADLRAVFVCQNQLHVLLFSSQKLEKHEGT